jgi:hypothetical protein
MKVVAATLAIKIMVLLPEHSAFQSVSTAPYVLTFKLGNPEWRL